MKKMNNILYLTTVGVISSITPTHSNAQTFYQCLPVKEDCQPGQYKDVNGCHTCPVGTYSNTINATSCIGCGEWKYSPDGKNCLNTCFDNNSVVMGVGGCNVPAQKTVFREMSLKELSYSFIKETSSTISYKVTCPKSTTNLSYTKNLYGESISPMIEFYCGFLNNTGKVKGGCSLTPAAQLNSDFTINLNKSNGNILIEGTLRNETNDFPTTFTIKPDCSLNY